MNDNLEINGVPLAVSGVFPRLCRLRDEYYQFVDDPADFLGRLKSARTVRADLFTFIQEVPHRQPRFQFHQEWDHAAVLALTTYDHWWKKQINDKTRNMIRKAGKTGVEARVTAYDEDLIRGIHCIYNECPVRQGRKFRHFGKKIETIREEHATFLDRSQFIGAYCNGRLIGFVKLVQGRGIANLMNIVSLISERDKAPTNALIAKAVEICTSKGIPYLQYGTGNTGSIGDFKRHHAFEDVPIPRYFVPLNVQGASALSLGLHRRVGERIPEAWRARITALRTRFAVLRLRNRNRVSAPASSGGQRLGV